MIEITCAELKQLIDSGAPHQLIDVREPYEGEWCSIGGIAIPMSEMMDRAGEIRRDVPVILYCRNGNRSEALIRALERNHGLTGLLHLKGGLQAWSQEVEPLDCY